MPDPMSDAAGRLLAGGAVTDAERAALDRLLARDPALRRRLVALARAILDGSGSELSPAEFGARMHAHIEAELDAAPGAADALVAAHLASAPEARAEYEALRESLVALRRGALPEPPAYPTFDVSFALARPDAHRPGRWRALARRIAAGGARMSREAPAAPRPPPGARRPGWREAALPALALAALVLLWLRGAPPPPPSAAERTATAAASVATATPPAPPTAAREPGATALFGPAGDPGAPGPTATRTAVPTRSVAPTEAAAPTAAPTRPPAPTAERGGAGGNTTAAPPPTARPAPSATQAAYPGELPTLAPTDAPPGAPTDPATDEPPPEPPATATAPEPPATP